MEFRIWEWGSELYDRFFQIISTLFSEVLGKGEKSQTICYFTVTYLLIKRCNDKNSRKKITAF